MTGPLRGLRAFRLLLPLVAIGMALLLFLGVGMVIGVIGFGGGGRGFSGPCDASLGPMSSVADAGRVHSPAQLSDEQRRNAALIISVAKGMGLPPRAWLVGLATAMQESALRNVHYGDRDSLGLFQQRPSQGWGSAAQVTDPVYAATTFFQRLVKVPGWERMPVTMAAQTVQRSAFPSAYARWEGLAAALIGTLSDVADPAGCGLGAVNLPDKVVHAAVGFALGEQGKPYVWGGTGPDSYDCSGLTMRAYQAAGIYLPRVASAQYRAGGHVPVQQARPGDLMFLATDPRDPATIHHVMIYLGDGRMVEAPYTGRPVWTKPVPWNDPELVPLATRPGTAPNPA